VLCVASYDGPPNVVIAFPRMEIVDVGRDFAEIRPA
jgi:hypothetical protein